VEEIPRPLPVNKLAQAPNHWVLFSCILKEWETNPHYPTSQNAFSKMQLTPIASNQTEIETADARIFFSYRTPVAAYVFGRGYVKSETWYSSTTSRHINKWMGKDIADTCETVSETFLRGLA